MARKRTNRTPKKAVTRTGAWKTEFLRTLALSGNVGLATKAGNVGRTQAYHERNHNKSFRQAWRTALLEAGDVMEAEAYRRAVKGVRKPVTIAGKKTIVSEYSDTLLIFLLKGTKPKKFRDNFHHEVTGKGGAAIKQNISIDLSGFSDDELLRFEKAFSNPSRISKASRN